MSKSFPDSNPLATFDHLSMARTLSDYLIELVRKKEELGNSVVADKLRALRDSIWPKDPAISPPSKELVFKRALEGLNSEQKTQLLEAYAHMGHLYEIAGLAARGNHFDHLREVSEPIPGGIREFIQKQNIPSDQIIEKLNKPVFEVVMTQHPTNTNSLESMQAQRELAIAIESKDKGKVMKALEHFEKAPLLHKVDGKETNFTARDETGIVLNFLGNIYDDLDRIYGQFDRSLAEKNDNYDPLKLNLSIRLGSWGSSGDKDGNNSITAETTLEAIALHTDAIVSRYLKDLKSENLNDDKQLAPWRKKLEEESKNLAGLLKDIGTLCEESEKIRKSGQSAEPAVLSARFDALSKDLAVVRDRLDAKQFEADLATAAGSGSSEHKKAAVEMVRKVRLFGFNFSKIEYRETAVEYSRVVSALIPGYDKLKPQEKLERLNEILSHDGAPAKFFERHKEEIVAAADKPYDKKSALPIAYHTLKRMELARDHGGIIRDNVLAECGKLEGKHSEADVTAQGAANILEAVLLQKAVERDGKRPLLGVVPLFEEPETMTNITGIMDRAYRNPGYQEHMKLLAKEHYDGKKTQQVQIAHSDNARRSGLQAARAYIHEAHKRMRELNKNYKIQTQFFEGGSISDAYRNGVRAISGSVDAFELHDFAKFTFQGGDLLNYFNTPGSIGRLFSRNIVHAVSAKEPDPDNKQKEKPNAIIDDIAIAALKRTLQDYQQQDFTTEKMGKILAALYYDEETKAGNRGSRAAARTEETAKGKLAFATGAKVQVGALHHVPIEIKDVRTIAFSEAWQHAGIVPSWLGSKNLDKYLQEETLNMLAQPHVGYSQHAWQEFDNLLKDVSAKKPLEPDDLQTFYKKSPTFKDAQDRTAFALAMTDPAALYKLQTRLAASEGPGKEKVMEYMNHIMETYRSASKTTYAAFEGKLMLDPRMARNLMTQALPRLAPVLVQKTDYRSFLQYSREQLREEGKLTAHLHGIIHNAGDTISHGRYLPADDPAYGRFLSENRQVGWIGR